MAKDIWVALASFCTCLCRRCLLSSSISAQVSCLIRLCNDLTASVVTGVIGVCSTSSCGQDLTSFGTVSSAGAFNIFRSTLSGLNGNNPLAAHPAVIFLLVNALSLAGLYREVKCSLLIVSKPPRHSRSTSSR